MTIGWKTLDVGEKALIYSKNGRARVEEGPQRLYLFREKFKKMTCYSASQKEFLVIKYKNGTTEHIKGPCIRHKNEIHHLSIEVRSLISLDANEVLVVYTQDSPSVRRRVQYGPTLFLLGENQWLHEFCWHGTDPENKTRMIPNRHRFTALKVIPDQFYYNVDEVRTADDALLRVKLMMFYELTDIEKMLTSTKDPMADFINCLCADVIAFTARKSYEEFIETASELNDLTNYPLLMERCKTIGYSVSKVVFRGYYAHDKLQMMHDVMIKRRTELRLKFESEAQEQSLIDMKLQAEINRLEQEQEMELENLLHAQKMEKSALEHQMSLEKQSHVQKLQKQREKNQALLDSKVLSDRLEFEHLKDLHNLNVDVARLLEVHAGKPGKVTAIFVDQGTATLHLHHNDPTHPILGVTSSQLMT
ncbi:uncharacterized protein LOC131957472 [Physella acuta]|uniref:uncharacterized protein LOC131957472 n=1 Tax=Physella acuta TaxID=109671 RepID=UPI0027DCA9E0|nr:uncharacterized protein LOC131957472 [Physella acuta]XP_059178300.1 uncharacterized protein LOC131957472 [Physella acuta]XP_059178308.1 uncharacterized protein LOC131957472 [Physella acuta]XP_059178310.1 uncharacterized protein LOC131957472 [Physella acuta]XP_059178311.1 uncharacterized protein LOC131957472 [Physella acuta]XP_059178312.1 uncharacterized protein LOC131957472 [Physella acuta]